MSTDFLSVNYVLDGKVRGGHSIDTNIIARGPVYKTSLLVLMVDYVLRCVRCPVRGLMIIATNDYKIRTWPWVDLDDIGVAGKLRSRVSQRHQCRRKRSNIGSRHVHISIIVPVRPNIEHFDPIQSRPQFPHGKASRRGRGGEKQAQAPEHGLGVADLVRIGAVGVLRVWAADV